VGYLLGVFGYLRAGDFVISAVLAQKKSLLFAFDSLKNSRVCID